MTARHATPKPLVRIFGSGLLKNPCVGGACVLAALCFAWATAPASEAAFVSYNVTAEEGDSWSGVIEVTDLNTPIASPGNPVQNNTWVSVSASGLGSFPANYGDGQWFGNPPNSVGFGYTNNNDGLYFASSSLYSEVYNNAKTWNELIALGPFGLAPAGFLNFAASFNNSAGNLLALTAGTVTFSAVPEPSTLVLAGLGVAAVAVWRRRRIGRA